jgi:hypothetical protein
LVGLLVVLFGFVMGVVLVLLFGGVGVGHKPNKGFGFL